MIDKVPLANNTIATCYRLRVNSALTGTAKPPPIVVKLTSEQLRLAVLRNKRLHTPKPNPVERDMGIQRIVISEDLTPDTYSKMRDLQRREEVAKTWSVNGRIKFMLSGSQAINSVASPYDSIETILSKANA